MPYIIIYRDKFVISIYKRVYLLNWKFYGFLNDCRSKSRFIPSAWLVWNFKFGAVLDIQSKSNYVVSWSTMCVYFVGLLRVNLSTCIIFAIHENSTRKLGDDDIFVKNFSFVLINASFLFSFSLVYVSKSVDFEALLFVSLTLAMMRVMRFILFIYFMRLSSRSFHARR